jgi:hypothetical protein
LEPTGTTTAKLPGTTATASTTSGEKANSGRKGLGVLGHFFGLFDAVGVFAGLILVAIVA